MKYSKFLVWGIAVVVFVSAFSPLESLAQTQNQFTQYLQMGTQGEQVTNLQRLLAQDPSIYPEGLITGYFGPMTEAAVKRLQAKNGLEKVGMVGPQTRNVLNNISSPNNSSENPSDDSSETDASYNRPSTTNTGTDSTNTPTGTSQSIVVISPNGGESVAQGSNLRITWDGSSSFGYTDKVTLYLMPLNFRITGNQPLTGSYEWTVPAQSDFIVPATNYSIRAVRDSYTIFAGSRIPFRFEDSSDTTFKIVAPGSTTQPTTPHLESVSLTASPLNSSQTSTLTLSATGANYCDWSSSAGGNRVYMWPVQKDVTLTQTTTYSATCYNTTYGESKNTSITVSVASTSVPLPTISVYASPNVITSGQSSTITLSPTNATYCDWPEAAGGGKSYMFPAQKVVSPTSTYTYFFTCYNSLGQSKGDSGDNVTVYVSAPNSPVPSPTVTLTASPTSITSGQSSTLSYSSTNATSCTASSQGFSGTTSGTKTVSPSQTTTYFITCYNSAGQSTTGSATVNVSTSYNPPTTLPLDAVLTASPTSITSGQSSTLTWTSYNVANCDASSIPGGGVAARTSGTINVSPTQTTTYTITCYNSAGQSTTGSATVNVTASYTPPTTSGLPDYVISATATPSSPSVNQETLLEVKWSNVGSGSGKMPSASVTNFSGASFLRVGSNSCGSKSTLEAGESCTLQYYISFPTVGSKTISLVVDNTNIATESNESNNTGSLTINVGSTSQSINRLTQIASIYAQLIELLKELEKMGSN